jgi:hypothetical protein
MNTLTYSDGQHKSGPLQNHRELLLSPGRRLIDGGAARRLLVNLAGLLVYAAESADSRELLAGLDLIRKAPGMLLNLEVR